MRGMKLGRGFSALQHYNYRLFWIGQTLSLVGTWMQTVAQAWLVLQLTGSAVDLGIVSALQQLPVLFIGIFGGVFADRAPKRELLIVTQTVQMLLALVLGILVSTGLVQMWHVYLLATLLGLSNAFDMPTRQAFVMEMVGRDDLMNAVALNSMQFNTARIIGPALAGITIALIGVTGSFYANAASFLFVIAGLFMMRSDKFFAVERAPKAPVLSSLREGCEYVWRTPSALLIVLIVGLLGMFTFNTQVLVPLFATDILHSGALGYGILLTGMGAGSLVAAFVAAFAQRARWRLVIGGAIGICLTELAFSFSRNYGLSLGLMVLTGFSMITMFTSANTGIQQRVPDSLRGRVMGVYTSVNMGTMPLGNLAAGALAASLGAPFAMGFGAVAALLTTAAIGSRIYLRRAEDPMQLEPEGFLEPQPSPLSQRQPAAAAAKPA
ncbi:MAG TPA: MFS transporter [Dehalococcoidia bacterium]|nr:MFS transporter [Dehalococcoidia bacterium]